VAKTTRKRTPAKKAQETSVVEETVVEEPIVAEVVVETVFGDSAEEQGKAQVIEEVGHNECPYCGCVNVLSPAGIAQAEELHEYKCSMCGKIHAWNTVLKKIAWMV